MFGGQAAGKLAGKTMEQNPCENGDSVFSVDELRSAFDGNQFDAYFQPQYDFFHEKIIGAEALARWNHPEKGLLEPAAFLPSLAAHGLLYDLDRFVWEKSCTVARYLLSRGYVLPGISVNLSRDSLLREDLPASLAQILERHRLPPDFLQLEIAESILAKEEPGTAVAVKNLCAAGFKIGLDDFGINSPLNILSGFDFNFIKLDMKYDNAHSNDKSGIIAASIIRMVNLLNIQVIAKNVEETEHADFLRSIGSGYIQGSIYSRPLPPAEFEQFLRTVPTSSLRQQPKQAIGVIAENFWNPASLDTLIFNHYVGAAMVLYEHDGIEEVLRVNHKYLQELGNRLSESEFVNTDLLRYMDDKNKELFQAMLRRAAASGEEKECEIAQSVKPEGDSTIFVRIAARLVGENPSGRLFYTSVRNITGEVNALADVLHREELFRAASEQTNMYYWEYIIATKDMHPCFRCKRDFKLPDVVANYPEPVIKSGVFPAEIADFYRDMIKRISNGESDLDVILPLSDKRIPFHVRYTTVYDADGKPVKAYGSATPV